MREIDEIKIRYNAAVKNKKTFDIRTKVEFEKHAYLDIPFLIDEISRLTTQVERLRAERDAAVRDIKITGDKDDEGICCEICKYYETPCPSRNNCFEWRGLED